MADEVVGSVQVNVHGDTDPLKRDIRQAAIEAGKTLDDNLGKGAGGTAITDNIVDQVADAEAPAGREAKKVGRAIANGVDVGTRNVDVSTRITQNLRDAETPLRKQAEQIAARIAEATSAASAVRWASAHDQVADIRLGVDVDRDQFHAGLAEVQRDWSEFGDSLSDTLDKSFAPGRFDRLFATLLPGAGLRKTLPGTQEGEASGRAVAGGMKKSMLQAGIEQAFLGLVTKAATIGPLIAFGIRGAAPILTGLVGQVSVLTTGLAGLGAVGAASLATMIPGVAALKIAFAGMDAEAKKALTEKFTKAAGDLAGFKERVRNEIIPSLVDATKTVSKLAPEINKLGTDAAKAGGRIAEAFATMLVGRKEEIGTIFGNSSKVMESFGNIGTKAVDVIINALDALQPLVMRAVGSIEEGLSKFTDTLNKGIDSGAFIATMEEWYDRGVLILQIFKNLGVVLKNFFGAAVNSSETFLASFTTLTEKWADWTESIEGQTTLRSMFAEAVPVVKEVWGLLGDIAGLFTQSFTGDSTGLVTFVQTLRTSVIPGIEQFQKLIRDSGIQDSLYDLADAVMHLFESGGGVGIQVFLDTLTIVVEVVGQLLDVLGPVIVPLTTFLTLFKSLAIAKTAFGGLLALPAMFTGITGPATQATKALEGVGAATAVAGGKAGDAGEKAAKGTGKFRGAVVGMGGVFNTALLGYAAFATIPKMLARDLPDSTERVNEFTAALKNGVDVLSLLDKTDVGSSSLDFLPNFSLIGDSMSSLDRIADDLDTSVSASINRWGADVLGVDVSGLEESRAAIEDMFTTINQNASATGDIEGTTEALKELTTWMTSKDIPLEGWQPQIDAVTDTLLTLQAEAAKGLSITGDFSNITTATKTFGQSWDMNVTKKFEDLAKNPAYTNFRTGALNEAGWEIRAKIIAEADMDSVNGVDNVLDSVTEEKIRAIHLDPKYNDKYGVLNEKGIKRVLDLTLSSLDNPENQKRLEQAGKDMNTIINTAFEQAGGLSVSPAGFEKAGEAAVRLYVPESNLSEIKESVESAFGERMISYRAELEAKGFSEAEIQRLMPKKAVEILAELQTANINEQLQGLMGDDYQIDLDTYLNPGDYLEVSGQLGQITADGKWEAVIGADADTARAEEEIFGVVEGPDGPYIAKIKVTDNGTASSTGSEIDDAARNRTTTITVKKVNYSGETNLGFKRDPKTGEIVAASMLPGGGGGGGESLIPGSPPPTISAGGPTTMGFGASASLSPFAGQRAAVRSAPGNDLQGNPNVWTGADKDKGAKSVTINNYYPEPERASDTIAMQMRIARYV